MKGHSKLINRIPVLFFDTETTGLGPGARVVQLAALVQDAPGSTRARFSHLIQPSDWIIDEGAQAVHGITLDDCKEFGIPQAVAMNAFSALVSSSKLIVAHNLNFDLGLIRTEVGSTSDHWVAMQSIDQFCTMRASTEMCKIPGRFGYKWPKLSELHNHLFGCDFEGAHDAMADVEACAKCYWEIQRLKEASK